MIKIISSFWRAYKLARGKKHGRGKAPMREAIISPDARPIGFVGLD